jgi:arabinose-5-phosphate isomerase
MTHSEVLTKARELLRVEGQAVLRCADRVGPAFEEAINLLTQAHRANRKIVLSGVGKSQYVARKVCASLMSTGVTAVFIHPSEALHGDLGVVHADDPVILFTKSGSTAELLTLLEVLPPTSPIIAITGHPDSYIAKRSRVVLDASVEQEACPINMLPTASTTVALAIGDALVAVLAETLGFSREVFAGYHPGGSIGKRLNRKVSEVMAPMAKVASGAAHTSIRSVAKAMSDRPLGAFLVLKNDSIAGIITDGDLRRAIAKGTSLEGTAADLMHAKPLILEDTMILEEAISLLEKPGRRVNCAPVQNNQGKLLGLVHLHDLL